MHKNKTITLFPFGLSKQYRIQRKSSAPKKLKGSEEKRKEKEMYLDIPFYYHTLQALEIVHCFHRIHMPFHIVPPRYLISSVTSNHLSSGGPVCPTHYSLLGGGDVEVEDFKQGQGSFEMVIAVMELFVKQKKIYNGMFLSLFPQDLFIPRSFPNSQSSFIYLQYFTMLSYMIKLFLQSHTFYSTHIHIATINSCPPSFTAYIL